MQGLGMGSGIDIKALAQSLVDATSKPQTEIIQKSIDKQKARTNAYDIVTRAINQLQEDLNVLAQPLIFSQFTTQSSMPSAVSVKGSVGAQPASHAVNVTQLAQAQRTVIKGSTGFPISSGGAMVGAGETVQINLTIKQQTHNLSITNITPEGVVSAINVAGLGVTASLVNLTGSQGGALGIVLTGDVGADNAFSIDMPGVSNVAVSQSRSAQDAELSVDGVEITRPNNQIGDVIPGAVLDLLNTTQGSEVRVSLINDTTEIKSAIKQFVQSYNDLQNIIDVSQDANSTIENLGGALVGDQSIQSIRDKIRSILMPPVGSSASGTDMSGSANLHGLRDLGLMIDTDGKMKFAHLASSAPNNQLYKVGDESTLDQQLANHVQEVQALFLGGSGKTGIASDMANALVGRGQYVDSTAVPSSPTTILLALKNGAGNRIKDEQKRLEGLQVRMQGLLDRYMQQFAVMDSLVGQNKATMKSLEASFASMNQSN
jgi:flagellar hook-associated protein 2